MLCVRRKKKRNWVEKPKTESDDLLEHKTKRRNNRKNRRKRSRKKTVVENDGASQPPTTSEIAPNIIAMDEELVVGEATHALETKEDLDYPDQPETKEEETAPVDPHPHGYSINGDPLPFKTKWTMWDAEHIVVASQWYFSGYTRAKKHLSLISERIARIEGTFNFNGQDRFIAGVFPYLPHYATPLLSSKCGGLHVILLEDLGVLPGELNRFKTGNTRSLLEASYLSVLRSINLAKFDIRNTARELKQHYKRFHSEYAMLDDDIANLINSDWAKDLLEERFNDALIDYERNLDLKNTHYCVTHGLSYDTELARYKYTLLGRFGKVCSIAGSILAFKGSILNSVISTGMSYFSSYNPSRQHRFMGHTFTVSEEVLAGYLTTGLSAFAYCASGGAATALTLATAEVARRFCEIGVTDLDAKKNFARDHLGDNWEIIPCYKKWIKIAKQTRELEEDPPLHDNVVIVNDFDHVNAEDQPIEHVDIFGSTIDKPSVYPASNNENLEAALRIRMMFGRDTDEQAITNFVTFAKSIIDGMDEFDVSQADPSTFLVHQYGTRRGQELLKLINNDIDTDKIKPYGMFVKGEVYLGKKVDNFKPRMIWSCPDEIIAKFGAHFHKLSKLFSKRWNVDSDVFYVNGSTPDNVGSFGEKLFSRPFVLESDVSNWDGSMLNEMLTLEKYFLKTKVTGMPEEIDILFENWGKNYGVSRDYSLQARSLHGRRSGDLWTSTFNSFLNWLISLWVYQIDDITAMTMMVLGDDNCLGFDNEPDIEDAIERYRSLGMKCEIIPREHITEMTFCSGRFWSVNGSYRWGNLPFRVLSKLGINHHNHSEKNYQGLFKGSCKSMLPTAGHVPIVGSFLRAIVDSADDVKAIYDNSHRNPYRIQGGVTLYPGMDTYLQFEQTYQISIETIVEIEEWIECNVDINDIPYLFDGDVFKSGFDTEFGTDPESINDTLEDLPRRELYDQICIYGPIEEEKHKLKHARGIAEAISNGVSFGTMEDHENGTTYHWFLHGLFSALSYVNLDWGIGLHQTYNQYALQYARFPCRRKKKKKQNTPNKSNVTKKSIKKMVKDGVKMALREGGAAIGGYLGGPTGAIAGRQVGGLVSKLTGMGDYHVDSNSLYNSGQFQFRSNSRTIRIAHTDFVGNVFATNDFNITSYPINPGLPTSFPWCNQLATPFQQYKLKGMVYFFNPLSAQWNGDDQVLGEVVLGTQYNVRRPSFTTKREMLNYEFSCSGLPTEEIIHPIECDPSESVMDAYYVRNGQIPDGDEPRFYDHGNFQVATTGFDTTVEGELIGEIYVAYDIEFLKPQIPPGGVIAGQYVRYLNGLSDFGDPLGVSIAEPIGNLDVQVVSSGVSNNRILFPKDLTGGRFFVLVTWEGTGIGVPSTPTTTLTNLTTFKVFNDSPDMIYVDGLSSNTQIWSSGVAIDGPSSDGSTIDFNFLLDPIVGAFANCTVLVVVLPGSDDFT